MTRRRPCPGGSFSFGAGRIDRMGNPSTGLRMVRCRKVRARKRAARSGFIARSAKTLSSPPWRGSGADGPEWPHGASPFGPRGRQQHRDVSRPANPRWCRGQAARGGTIEGTDDAFFPAPTGKWALRSFSEAGADGAAAAGCGETLVRDTAALRASAPPPSYAKAPDGPDRIDC